MTVTWMLGRSGHMGTGAPGHVSQTNLTYGSLGCCDAIWPAGYNLNNTQTALDKSISARAVLLNEKRHSRLARSERRFFNSIPRPSNEQVLRRFVFYNEECRAFRINTKCDTCIILSYLIYNLHKAMVLIKFQIND